MNMRAVLTIRIDSLPDCIMKAPSHALIVGGLSQKTIGREWTPYHSVNEY